MVLLRLWTIFLCLLVSAQVTGNTLNDNDTDIIYAITGEQAIIGTWPLNGSTLFISVTRDNSTRLMTFVDGTIDKHSTVQRGRLILKYNHTVKEATLMFDKVSREDEGLYEIEESLYRSNEATHEIESEGSKKNNGSWRLELNVFGPSEVKQGYAGENVIMKFGKTSVQSKIYNYDQAVALLLGSVCSILTDSYWYGRLRCTSDDLDEMYTLTIEDVTQRDAGLYEVTSVKNKVGRCFLDIKDKPIRAVVEENTSIGWFYNQQGMNRTLLVIHPNQEVMMLVPRTNIPQIESKFQHRLLYSGDASKSFMSFTLMHLRPSDAGLYTIETLHGNTIPGSKELIVEVKTTSAVRTDDSSVPASVSLACKVESLVWGAACLLLLMTVCLICVQQRSRCRQDAAQRLLLEKCETVSFSTHGTIMNPLPMSPLEEVRMDQPVTQSDGVCNAILGLHYAASIDLAAAHTECSSPFSQVHMEYDKLTSNNGVDCNEPSDRINRTAWTACHDDVEKGILEVGSTSVSTFVTTLGIDEDKYNGKDQKLMPHSGLAFYAKVKNRQKASPRNTAPLSRWNELVQGTEEEDLYEKATTPMNRSVTEDIKVFEDEDTFGISDL